MTQNGFLGTIGWIKSNLMVSSQASEKGYSNENFYPGAESIPDSEPKATFLPISFKTNNVTIDENGLANIGGKKNRTYIDLLNTPDLATFQNWEFGFRAKVLSNGDYKFICGIEGASGTFSGNYAFQLLNADTNYKGVMLNSSGDSNYQLKICPTITDSDWHDFKVKWETGVGFTASVDDNKITKYRANFTSNAGKNIRWGFNNAYYTTNIDVLDTKSVYLKWWNN